MKTVLLRIQSICNGFDKRAKDPGVVKIPAPREPIFIVGAPRSGSTLLYQLLAKHLKVAYISNLMALIPNRIIQIAILTKKFNRHARVAKSHYGYINGLFSPSEAGALMRRWFGSELHPTEALYLRNTFGLLSQHLEGALLIKNLMNVMRLEMIDQVFPEARFIHISRDPYYNAQSIFVARKKLAGSEAKWWSVKPHGAEAVQGEHPLFQIAWQIDTIQALVNQFLAAHKGTHVKIAYEDLCVNPRATIAHIEKRLELNVMDVDICHSLPNMNIDRLQAPERALLIRATNRYKAPDPRGE